MYVGRMLVSRCDVDGFAFAAKDFFRASFEPALGELLRTCTRGVTYRSSVRLSSVGADCTTAFCPCPRLGEAEFLRCELEDPFIRRFGSELAR